MVPADFVDDFLQPGTVALELTGVIGEAGGLVGKFGEPVAHFDVFGREGLSVVEVFPGLGQRTERISLRGRRW